MITKDSWFFEKFQKVFLFSKNNSIDILTFKLFQKISTFWNIIIKLIILIEISNSSYYKTFDSVKISNYLFDVSIIDTIYNQLKL